MADTQVKRGRGRPAKNTVVNKEVKKRPAEQNGDVQPDKKRGRGRPRLPEAAKKIKVKTGKRGRPPKKDRKKSDSEEDKNKSEESENDQRNDSS